MPSWFMYLWGPVGGVIITFTTIALFQPFYGRLMNPLFSAPHERKLSLSDIISSFCEIWGIYLVALFVISITLTGTPYIVKSIALLKEDNLTPENVKQFIENNKLLLTLLQDNLFFVCFIIISARIVALTYSDFLVNYLIFNTIVIISLFVTFFPWIVSLGNSKQFFDYFTDHYFNPGIQDYILSIVIYSFATAAMLEFSIEFIKKISIILEKPIKSSFNWTNRLIQLHEMGEQFHSRESVIANSAVFVRDTLFGNELKQIDPQPFISLDILTRYGTKAIFKNIFDEILYWYASYYLGIGRGYAKMYYELNEEKERCSHVKGKSKIDEKIRKLMEEIREQVKQRNLKLAEKSPEELIEMARIPLKEMEEKLDEILKSGTQKQLSEKTRIIAPLATCRIIHQLWGVDKNVFKEQPKIGNHRYMILNNGTLSLGYTLPYRQEDCVNAGFVMRDLTHRIQTYISHFDDLWERSASI